MAGLSSCTRMVIPVNLTPLMFMENTQPGSPVRRFTAGQYTKAETREFARASRTGVVMTPPL